MNRIIGALLVGLGVAGAALAIAVASVLSAAAGLRAQAGGEQILRYDVAVAIQRDASILVTERIVYDFGGQARHGIIRGIPVQYPYSASYDRITPLTVRSVGSPDARPSTPWTTPAARSPSRSAIRTGRLPGCTPIP